MNKEQREKVKSALVDFILRASSEKATPEEVQVLPAVVAALVELANI